MGVKDRQVTRCEVFPGRLRPARTMLAPEEPCIHALLRNHPPSDAELFSSHRGRDLSGTESAKHAIACLRRLDGALLC